MAPGRDAVKPPRCQHCAERADRVIYFRRSGHSNFMYVCRAHFETYEALEALKR